MAKRKGQFTKENAREMQRRGARKKAENATERKLAKNIISAIFDEVKPGKNGEKMTYKEIMIRNLLKGAIVDGDLAKAKYLIELAGEAPENVSKLDVTTNGKALSAPKLVFAPTPLTERDIAEIKALQDGRKTDSTDTGVSETESGL